MSKSVKENSFDGAVAGSVGSVSFQPSLGTHSSPSNYQDSSKFNGYYDSNTTGQPDTQISDASGSFDGDVERLFKDKPKPTVDDIKTGIDYELSHMIHKDKNIAKQRVIANMKKHGADYYSNLDMLNIDDKNLDVTPVMQERINVLNQMVSDKQSKREPLKLNSAIQDILQEKRDQKNTKSTELFKRAV